MILSGTLANLAAAALAAFALSASAGTIKVDGSSTVYPITDFTAANFKNIKKGAVQISLGISGTTGGMRKFCRGDTDISGASRPINETEMASCKSAGVDYIELPVAFDALTIVVHPRNAFAASISVDELKRLWEPAAQGRIQSWRQVNPNWPDEPIRLFAPGVDSGTFDYFTEAIVGRARASRLDYTASEDDNVLVLGVARDAHALAYFGYAYYAANKGRLRALPIAAGDGQSPVAPSLQSVNDGSYRPLSRPLFIYVNTKALTRSEVREFAEFYITNASRAAAAANYIPLPAATYLRVHERLKQSRKGSVFAGAPVIGMTIEDLLKRESGP